MLELVRERGHAPPEKKLKFKCRKMAKNACKTVKSNGNFFKILQPLKTTSYKMAPMSDQN